MDRRAEFHKYAENVIEEFQIDESHGINHLLRVVDNIKIILREFKDVAIIEGLTKDKEEEIICDAGFFHDLVDSKYRNETSAVEHLAAFLKTQQYPDLGINIIIHIITTMSFSKRRLRQSLGLPMIEPGPYELAVKIVVDADQLDAYDPGRCQMYQDLQWKGHPQAEIMSARWVKTIMVKRVLLYKDTYMYTETARALADPLHKKVEEYVRGLGDLELVDY